MPIVIPETLPAFDVLKEENVFVMNDSIHMWGAIKICQQILLE